MIRWFHFEVRVHRPVVPAFILNLTSHLPLRDERLYPFCHLPSNCSLKNGVFGCQPQWSCSTGHWIPTWITLSQSRRLYLPKSPRKVCSSLLRQTSSGRVYFQVIRIEMSKAQSNQGAPRLRLIRRGRGRPTHQNGVVLIDLTKRMFCVFFRCLSWVVSAKAARWVKRVSQDGHVWMNENELDTDIEMQRVGGGGRSTRDSSVGGDCWAE